MSAPPIHYQNPKNQSGVDLVKQAGNIEKYRQPYNKYVIEQQSSGEKAKTFADWVADQLTLNEVQASTPR